MSTCDKLLALGSDVQNGEGTVVVFGQLGGKEGFLGRLLSGQLPQYSVVRYMYYVVQKSVWACYLT